MKKSDLILFSILLLIAVAFRTVFKIGPNIEFVTISALAGGYFFTNKKLALLLPIIILGISDAIIGNSSIFMFTWSAFLITPIIGILAKSGKFKTYSDKLPSFATPAIVGLAGTTLSVLIFFLWTNFGVVVTTSMYPNTIQGLINSYINALPFLRNQLYTNMIFAPIIFTMINTLYSLRMSERIKTNTIKSFRS